MIELDFAALVRKIQELLARGFDAETFAARLTLDGIVPPLGARAWTREVVDRVMVYAEAHRVSLERTRAPAVTRPPEGGNDAA